MRQARPCYLGMGVRSTRIFADNLFERGMHNYRTGNFSAAVVMLAQALNANRPNWQARLYLARACYNAGMIHDAMIHFKRIAKSCDDTEICESAMAEMAHH